MKKIKLVEMIPKDSGTYLTLDSKENLILVNIWYDEDHEDSWIYDYPHANASMPIEKPILCYGPIGITFKQKSKSK